MAGTKSTLGLSLGRFWKLLAAPAALASVLACTLALALPTAAALAAPAKQTKQAQRSQAAAAKPVRKMAAPARGRTVKAAGLSKRKVAAPPPRLSVGQLAGLHGADDPLDLRSSVALVIDQESDEVLFSKNPDAVLPIASITKLMTALVVVESRQPLGERLSISDDDVDIGRNSRSRLKVGTELTRGELLHLALMASENRAAHALGRHHPGGMAAFVAAMNAKARLLGMSDTKYVEPTGLSAENRSSATDLTLLVRAASAHQLIRDLSTTLDMQVPMGRSQLQYRNTNGLVRDPSWSIDLQKTGYISDAGRCVVMQAELYGRKLIMVLLDSAGKYSRIADAHRIRDWLATAIPPARAQQLNRSGALPLPVGSSGVPTPALPPSQ